jgi:hypothetical protein
VGQGIYDIETFEDRADQFMGRYVKDGFVDYKAIVDERGELNALIDQIKQIDYKIHTPTENKAYFINVYNVLVIDQIVNHYPTTSVKDIPGFFQRAEFTVGGNLMTLNYIEKFILLDTYDDSRLHLVLVCGAKDCPRLWNKAFRSKNLEEQMITRSQMILNDPNFIMITEKGVGLSEIFKWNIYEFGGKNDVIKFINLYREEPIASSAKTFYYDYDWTLNDVKFSNNKDNTIGNNSFRYVTSAAIPKGGVEIKLFNNLYSQFEDWGSHTKYRSTYFTTSISFLYGSSNRFNVGFVSRYRRVRNSVGESALAIFKNSRQGITAFGPQVRWAPSESWPNLSIQSSLTFPLGSELSGGTGISFLDWSGPVFITQFFNDKSIGDKFSLFTEIDLLIEEIGGSGKANRISTPITGIFSWFPVKNFTIYGLVGYSPYYVKPYDYFIQLGLGMKFQLSPDFEIEILLTDFSNRYLNLVDGNAATYNLGFRYSR